MNVFVIGFDTIEKQNLASLMIDSLKNIEQIIRMSKRTDSEIKFEDNDEGLLSVLYMSSNSWMKNMIDKLESSYLINTPLDIERQDLLILKYFTEMFWHHTACYDISYKGFDLELAFNNLENKQQNLKNILKIVK